MKNRPQFSFCNTRSQKLAHFRDRNFAGCEGAAHGIDLVDALYSPCVFHELHTVADFDAGGVQCAQAGDLNLVDCKASVLASLRSQQLINLPCKTLGNGFLLVASHKIVKARTVRADLVHQWQML